MMRLPAIPRAALGPILLASLIVLLAFWHTPAPRPAIAPPYAVTWLTPPERSLAPGQATPTPVPVGGQFVQRQSLDIMSADGLFAPEEHARLAIEFERALNYVSARFGSGPMQRISAYVGSEPGCGLHGIAYTDQRTVQVFTCAGLPRDRVVTIVAHEFVHQLAHDRYGPRHLEADLILSEGVATWGAGDYWLSGQPDFAAFVRQYQAAGQLLPLATSYVGRSIGDMNMLYYQWASFVEFLISNYGRELFDAVYITGSRDPGSADYEGVYGKSIGQLEQEWLAWLNREF